MASRWALANSAARAGAAEGNARTAYA